MKVKANVGDYIRFSYDGFSLAFPCYPYAQHVYTAREAWREFYRELRNRIREGTME